MKRIMTICVAAAAAALFGGSLTGCKDGKGNGKLDPNAKVSIWGKTSAQGAPEIAGVESKSARLTPLEVVKQADKISSDVYPGGRGFADAQRDIANVRLLMWGTDVITDIGELNQDFLRQRNNVFVTFNDNTDTYDTIAYIPNAIISKAQTEITNAYNKGDYETCYSLFDAAFRFVPITGEEWRALTDK